MPCLGLAGSIQSEQTGKDANHAKALVCSEFSSVRSEMFIACEPKEIPSPVGATCHAAPLEFLFLRGHGSFRHFGPLGLFGRFGMHVIRHNCAISIRGWKLNSAVQVAAKEHKDRKEVGTLSVCALFVLLRGYPIVHFRSNPSKAFGPPNTLNTRKRVGGEMLPHA